MEDSFARGVLTANPDASWLAGRQGEHFLALRLFAEAYWAREGLHSQSHLAANAVRWNILIQSRKDLFDYMLAQRRKALLWGFFDLTTEQLEALANLHHLAPHQQTIRDQFLALSGRQEVRQDLHGQILPDTLFAISLAIEQAPPYRTQGLCGETKRVRVQKRGYFAKMTDETLSGRPIPGDEDFNAVTANAAIRALQPAIVPQETYHFIAADGSHCTFAGAFVGKTYISRPRAAAHVAPLVDLIWLQWVVMMEWLFGLDDRLAGNLSGRQRTSPYWYDRSHLCLEISPEVFGLE